MKTLLLLFAIAPGVASEIQIIDQKTGFPLPGVNITVVGTVEGLNTDLDGYFFLNEARWIDKNA